MKTLSLRKEDATHDWFIVDASDKILGRLATKIADRIRGKDKPTFTPHTDGGDYVVVINAEKIRVTGAKFTDKKYYYLREVLNLFDDEDLTLYEGENL